MSKVFLDTGCRMTENLPLSPQRDRDRWTTKAFTITRSGLRKESTRDELGTPMTFPARAES